MAEAITKHPHAQQVLVLLSQTSEEHVSVEDMAVATNLGAVIYPVLSSLHEQGMVEPHWLRKVAGPQLNYQITLKGLESLRRMTVTEEPARPALAAEPALLKLKGFMKRDADSGSK
jgi:DNA-binding PadR family transcriptional regulator